MEIHENIDEHDIELPLLLIQPYIENAIKHGLHHKQGDKALKVAISWEKEDEILTIEIDDNGIGRPASQAIYNRQKRQHQSFATAANEERLKLINRTHKSGVDVVFVDKKDKKGQATGTTVLLSIVVKNDFD